MEESLFFQLEIKKKKFFMAEEVTGQPNHHHKWKDNLKKYSSPEDLAKHFQDIKQQPHRNFFKF